MSIWEAVKHYSHNYFRQVWQVNKSSFLKCRDWVSWGVVLLSPKYRFSRGNCAIDGWSANLDYSHLKLSPQGNKSIIVSLMMTNLETKESSSISVKCWARGEAKKGSVFFGLSWYPTPWRISIITEKEGNELWDKLVITLKKSNNSADIIVN